MLSKLVSRKKVDGDINRSGGSSGILRIHNRQGLRLTTIYSSVDQSVIYSKYPSKRNLRVRISIGDCTYEVLKLGV